MSGDSASTEPTLGHLASKSKARFKSIGGVGVHFQ
jgi:hypothetical protein